MPRIPIISDRIDAAKPKHIPSSRELSTQQPRFRPPGGKPPLPLTSSYNRQGSK